MIRNTMGARTSSIRSRATTKLKPSMKDGWRAFPKSIAMVYANFMPGGRPYLEAVYKAARESNVAVGGPDLLPFRPFQRANSYPLIRASAGKIPTGLAVQDGNYSDVNQ